MPNPAWKRGPLALTQSQCRALLACGMPLMMSAPKSFSDNYNGQQAYFYKPDPNRNVLAGLV